MDEKDLKEIVTSNLIKYRKAHNYTQATLAEKINYSDKAISKLSCQQLSTTLILLLLN